MRKKIIEALQASDSGLINYIQITKEGRIKLRGWKIVINFRKFIWSLANFLNHE